MSGQRSRSQRTVQTRIRQLSEFSSDVITERHFRRLGIYVKQLDLEPPSSDFFQPLTDEFLAAHPLSKASIKKADTDHYKIPEYDPEKMPSLPESSSWDYPFKLRLKSRLLSISCVLDRHAAGTTRENFGEDFKSKWSLCEATDWYRVVGPIPLSEIYYVKGPIFSSRLQRLESVYHCTEAGLPHVTMVVDRHTEEFAVDGELMRHELLYMLKVMEIRYAEGIFDKDQPQPVLFVSFMGPQHGRILQAYIENGTRLVIECSRKYSFERNETAPFELFYRWFLATPVGIQPVEVPSSYYSSEDSSESEA